MFTNDYEWIWIIQSCKKLKVQCELECDLLDSWPRLLISNSDVVYGNISIIRTDLGVTGKRPQYVYSDKKTPLSIKAKDYQEFVK